MRCTATRGLEAKLIAIVIVWLFALFSLFDAMYGFSHERFYLQLLVFFGILLWVTSRTEAMSFVFYFIFGIFFVIPFLVFGSDFLRDGTFYDFSVRESSSKEMASFLLSFIVISTALQLFFNQQAGDRGKVTLSRIKSYSLFTIIQVLSFAVIVSFNFSEALLVWEEGYASLFAGDFGIKKSVLIFSIEVLFLTCSVIDLTRRRMFGIVLFVTYLISTVIIGQRLPGVLSLLIVAIFLFPRWFAGFRFAWVALLAFGALVPALQLLAGIRDQGIEVLDSVNILDTYVDIWRVIGFSADTLKAAFWYEGQIQVDVSPLAKLKLIIQVGVERIFGMDLSWTIGGYGREFSRQLGPDLFNAKSVTFASSGLAESYYFFGMFGSFVYALICVVTAHMLHSLAQMGGFMATTLLIQFAPRFLGSIRNELFGWLWEAIMISAFMIVVFYVLRLIRAIDVPRKINSSAAFTDGGR